MRSDLSATVAKHAEILRPKKDTEMPAKQTTETVNGLNPGVSVVC